MKRLSQQLEDKLLDYIDGKLDPMQRASLEQMLQADDQLRRRYNELMMADAGLKRLKPITPPANFTAAVMNRLHEQPVKTGLSIRGGLLLLAGMTAVMIIALVLVNSGYFDSSVSYDLDQLSLIQRYFKQNLPSVSLNGKLIVSSIMLLNLVLVFIVLDRAVLRPLFLRRMQTGH